MNKEVCSYKRLYFREIPFLSFSSSEHTSLDLSTSGLLKLGCNVEKLMCCASDCKTLSTSGVCCFLSFLWES